MTMRKILYLAILMATALSLSACGARLGGGDDNEAPKKVSLERPNTATARAVQVSWTAARANFCAFGMNKEKLRADYLAYEGSQGATPDQIAYLERTYDVTYQTFYARVKEIPNYCTRVRIDQIRPDINRHLRGDYTPSARTAPPVNKDDGRYIPVEEPPDPLDSDPAQHLER